METMMTADEAFTVGTAVVISPIGEAVHEGKTHTFAVDSAQRQRLRPPALPSSPLAVPPDSSQ